MPRDRAVPIPLAAAALVVLVEAIALVALGVLELRAMRTDRAVMGVSTAGFFLAFGSGLAACAWALWRGRRWGRGPVLMAQLIALLLSWSFWGDGTRAVSVVLIVLGVSVLVGMLHPRSIEALEQGKQAA